MLKDHDNPVWNLGANLLAPIFKGGALKTQVEIRTAEQKQAVAAYASVGLRAFGEVESALAAEIAAREREQILVADARRQPARLRRSSRRSSVSVELRTVAEQQLAGMDRALDAYRQQRHTFAQIAADEVRTRLQTGDIILLDVRPAIEYTADHLPGALSIPLEELPQRLAELPTNALIVTYCRGPLCVYADQALELIIASGRDGARLEAGVAEWQLAGYPLNGDERVTTGTNH